MHELIKLLKNKMNNQENITLIHSQVIEFDNDEKNLLSEILNQLDFNDIEENHLLNAIKKQVEFNPDSSHVDDDDETTGFCAHCLTPTIPPLRDYLIRRQKMLVLK